jgi:predicted permease
MAMRWLHKLPLRLRSIFRWKDADSELEREIRFHIERQTAVNIEAGMAPEEARCAALREFGGAEQLKEDCRDARGIRWLQDFWQDAGFGLRILSKSPGFTAVAILTLTLGIGANTAIFSVLETQLWRPLPFPDSERLMDPHVVLRENTKRWDVLSVRGFRDWLEQSHTFRNLAGYRYPGDHNITLGGTSRRLAVMPVTANFFDTMGVPLSRGRAFLRDEETPGREHVAILADAVWRDQFASDPAILGKPIILDGETYTVVGIASPDLRFDYMPEPAIYIPLALDASAVVIRNLYVVGRLASGATPERASEELTAIIERTPKSERAQPEDIAAVTSLRETWTGFAGSTLFFFAGAVGLVLIIACVNTAGLMFARGLTRQREFAVRAALGAPRNRLVRQLLAESVILALAGGAAGTAAGYWLATWFTTFVPPDMLPRNTPPALDTRILLFTLAISAFSALLAGVIPSVFASRTDLNQSLRQSAPGRSASRSQRYARGSLVAIELALGLVLLLGAGLFLSSFIRLQQAPLGFEASGALSFRVSLRGKSYTQPDDEMRYFDRLTEQLKSMPGVRAVTFGSGLPLTGSEDQFSNVNVSGQPVVHEHGTFVLIHSIAPNYAAVLHIAMLAGRIFNSQDTQNSPRVALVNRNAARELFGTENPVGKVLEFLADERRGVPAQAPVQIVGMIENVQEYGANEVPFNAVYVPFSQHPLASANVLVDSSVPRGALASAVRDVAFELDDEQPVFDMKTMDDLVSESLEPARFNFFLVGALAAAAILLVSVGVFGTVSYFVEQRTQEFGIRLSLGATPGRVLRHAIGQSLRIGVAGVAIGVATWIILGRVLQHVLYLVPGEREGMIYGVKIYDPLTMVCGCALLVGVFLLASYIPARRAAKVDPMIALRHE